MNIICELADCASPLTPAGSCRYDSSLGIFSNIGTQDDFISILIVLYSCESFHIYFTDVFRSFDKKVCRSI
jgi:hypothetical protein